MRPAVRVWIAALSSSSPVCSPCAATSVADRVAPLELPRIRLHAELRELLEVRAPLAEQIGFAGLFSHTDLDVCSRWGPTPTSLAKLDLRLRSLGLRPFASRGRSFPVQLLAHRVEHAVDEPDRLVAAE